MGLGGRGGTGGVTSSWWIEGLSGLRNSRASKKSCQGLELEKRTCQWLASKHSGHNAENIHACLRTRMLKWARNRCSQMCAVWKRKLENETEELQKNVELWWCHRHYNNPHPPTAHTQTKQMTRYNIYENINSNFPPMFSIVRNIVSIFLFPSFKNKFDKENHNANVSSG